MSKIKKIIANFKAENIKNSDNLNDAPIVEALYKFNKRPSIGFHIPGHTGGRGAWAPFRDLIGKRALELDMTDEFDGIGTLHPATGPIKEAQELAAKAFGAQKTFFLLGGSTVGNLALAFALSKPNSKILINRNCHRSILTGMVISGANPTWLMPKKLEEWSLWGALNPSEIENELIKNPDTSLVWITNPTYEGVITDIGAISKICKKYKVPLIVDEAHGSLWNFSPFLPESSLHLGADAVIHSLHKTGGSMSQSSLLHITKDSAFNPVEVEKALKLLHSTSPSILLLASLDAARANLVSKNGTLSIEKMIKNSFYLRDQLTKIDKVSILTGTNDFKNDPTKVFIKIEGLSGLRLESILEIDFNIEIESACDQGVLTLINLGNTKKEIDYLINAIKTIAKKGYTDIYHLEGKRHMPLLNVETVLNPREAYMQDKETVLKENSIGRICGEVIAECPPGISILLPGELIREEHLPYLANYETIEVIKGKL